MSRKPSHIDWPRSLKSAAAVDDLAQHLYGDMCLYVGTESVSWDQVPMYLRSGFVEVAMRTLRIMTSAPKEDKTADPLFALATDLARMEGRRLLNHKVIATITEDAPWGDAA